MEPVAPRQRRDFGSRRSLRLPKSGPAALQTDTYCTTTIGSAASTRSPWTETKTRT